MHVVHRKNTFRAEQILQKRLFANSKISVIWEHVLEEVVGTHNPKSVNGVRLKNVKTEKFTDLTCDGVFVAIGHKPNTAMFKDQLNMDSEGYIITAPDSTATNIAGVYAAGDVQDKIYRQAVTAAGTGCMAALEADKFLRDI